MRWSRHGTAGLPIISECPSPNPSPRAGRGVRATNARFAICLNLRIICSFHQPSFALSILSLAEILSGRDTQFRARAGEQAADRPASRY